jgi:RNA polymerase sigma-70 factor (ECF subfamily)
VERLAKRLGGDVVARLVRELEEARAKWPEAPCGDEFVAYLIERIEKQAELESVLPRLRIGDLLLAWWAGTGDVRGIEAFEKAHEGDLRKLEQRFHRLPAEDLRQQLRIKLFVGTAETPPRIRAYSGFGFLENWVRVTAARSFVDAARAAEGRAVEAQLDSEMLLGWPDAKDDPAIATARSRLGDAVKRAFGAAIAGLAPRQRNLLRNAYVDRLTLDQIAAVWKIHRATVARILADARAQLVNRTREGVVRELGILPDELSSAVAQLDSRLDLSLSRVLAEP